MMKKIVFFLLLCVALIVSVGYLWFRSVTAKTFIVNVKKITPVDNSIPKKFSDKRPIDILLLGYGGGKHDGPYLTDSMMVAHIDPSKQKIFLISLPRDLWVKIPTNGADGNYWKINSAYAIGLDDAGYPNKLPEYSGPEGASRLSESIVSEVTGLPIANMVGIDFTGFTDTINTLGGVDVNVETTFDDFAYPKEDLKDTETSCGHSDDDIKAFTATVSAEPQIWDYFPCRYEHLHFDAGMTHMDGVTALKYVRSRHSAQDGTDFGRAKRQRNVLLAVKQKIVSIDFIPKAIPFISSLGNDLRTDLTMSDIQTFIQNASALSKYEIVSLALTDKNYLIDTFSDDKQSILAPKAGIGNWGDIHSWIDDEIHGKPTPVSANVLVENGTKTSGLAQSVTNILTDANIETLPPKNASNLNAKQTTVIVYGTMINLTDMNILKSQLAGFTFSYQNATTSAYNVLIVVGDDYVKKAASPTPSK